MNTKNTLYNLHKIRTINDLKDLENDMYVSKWELNRILAKKYYDKGSIEPHEKYTWEKLGKFYKEYKTAFKYAKDNLDTTYNPFINIDLFDIFVYELMCRHILMSTEFIKNLEPGIFRLNETNKEIIINQIWNDVPEEFSY